MKTAKELLHFREQKIAEWMKFDEKVKGQWRYIEGKADTKNINRNTKYIELGKIELYKENIRKLLDLGYFISEDKNGQVKLYFDMKDYNNVNINSDRKENLNKSINNEIKVNTEVVNLDFEKWEELLSKISRVMEEN